MNVLIDSSAWIEYLSGGPRAGAIEKYFKTPYKIVTPTIVTYEIYKKIKFEQGELKALNILAQIETISSSVIDLNQGLAVQAADLSLEHKLPMADALIYSTALFSSAKIVTMDKHFRELNNVVFIS